jgi:hypothetical protein
VPPQAFPSPATITRTGIGILSGGTFTFDRNSGGVASGGLAPLAYLTDFYWRVEAINADGVTLGPTWRFATQYAAPPATPSSPTPSDGSTGDLAPTLSWAAAAGALNYDVYFGTVNPPTTLVSSAQAGTTFTPSGPLVDLTTYYWKIVARNAAGTTTGPVWSFTAEDSMVIDRDVTMNDVVNTTTETTVYSFTVPGGTLSTNRALRVSLIGDYLNNSGGDASFNMRLYYGGVVFGTVGAVAPANANRRSMRGDWLVSAANAANAQVGRHNGMVGGLATINGGGDVSLTTFEGAKNNGAIDSTVDQPLVVKFEHNVAHASLSARALAVIVEKL